MTGGAKWAWKCTVITAVTFRDHLFGVHFLAASVLDISARENLDSHHPIRRLTKPFTYGTVGINFAATQTLTCENSMFHRATTLTWGSVATGFSKLLSVERGLPTASAYMKQRGLDALGSNYTFGEDWRAFEGIMGEFVGKYVDLYYADDAAVKADTELASFWASLRSIPDSALPEQVSGKKVLTTVLASYFCLVTGMHNQVGNVADYIVDPSICSGKIRPGSELADVQAAFQMMNVGLATAAKGPKLMGDVSHLLLDDRAREVWAGFHRSLEGLEGEITERNAARGIYATNAFLPSKNLVSVSI